MGSLACARRVLAEARHGVSPSRAREKRAGGGSELGNAGYVNHGPEMTIEPRVGGRVLRWGNPRRRHIGAHGQESEEHTSNRAPVCARGNVVPGLWVLDASNRRRLSFPASSEAGKAIPRPGRGFQGGRRT